MALSLPTQNLPSFSSFITIKLSQTNFPLWKAQVSPYLKAHHLYPLVDGTLPCPQPTEADEPNPDYDTWQTKSNKEEEGSEEDTLTMSDAFESRGIRAVEEGYEGRYGYLKSSSLSLATLIEVLKQKTGKEDIHVGKLRPTLFHMFGDNATPKVKRFVEVILNKVRHKGEGGSDAVQTQVDSAQEAYYGGGAERDLPENGILLSGCQSNQTSTDISPEGGAEEAYGTFTNAILTIIEESGGEISNRELVVKARELLESQGFKQRPGLYCCDQYADAPFAW